MRRPPTLFVALLLAGVETRTAWAKDRDRRIVPALELFVPDVRLEAIGGDDATWLVAVPLALAVAYSGDWPDDRTWWEVFVEPQVSGRDTGSEDRTYRVAAGGRVMFGLSDRDDMGEFRFPWGFACELGGVLGQDGWGGFASVSPGIGTWAGIHFGVFARLVIAEENRVELGIDFHVPANLGW